MSAMSLMDSPRASVAFFIRHAASSLIIIERAYFCMARSSCAAAFIKPTAEAVTLAMAEPMMVEALTKFRAIPPVMRSTFSPVCLMVWSAC